jgi:hypothetical protein
MCGVAYGLVNMRLKTLGRMPADVNLALTALFLSILFATQLSAIRYDVWFDRSGVLLLLGMLLNIGVFVTLWLLLVSNSSFAHLLYRSFYLPLLIFWPFLLFPPLALLVYVSTQFEMLSPGEARFSGFSSNPSVFGQTVLVALAFVYLLFLAHLKNKRWGWSIAYLAFTGELWALLIWSQSRGALVTATLLTLGETVAFGNRTFDVLGTIRKRGRLAYNAFVLTGLALAFIGAILATPIATLGRIGQFAAADRLLLGSYYTNLLAANPFGLGFNYTTPFTLKRPETGTPLPPHDSVFGVAILGGFGAVLSVAYLLWKSYRNVKRELRRTNDESEALYLMGAFAAIVGVWFNGLFEGPPLYFLGFWVLLALTLSPSARSPSER